VICGDYPLLQLQHVGAAQDVLELRLTHQKALQQGLRAVLQVGQHAQFLKRAFAQILGFVDDQERAPTGCLNGRKKSGQFFKNPRLWQVKIRNAKRGRHHLQ
jgi:hypothetical protein